MMGQIRSDSKIIPIKEIRLNLLPEYPLIRVLEILFLFFAMMLI